ncbi:carboxynorspermidine decarboxylase [Alkalispirochaeta sphaeroplastigenens]|uniref:carboxynorspermidine decarboxylase n=1 Tax=Alkalispirochaeta sphaeroplastigenens TaxID=1187066 RepID=UPI0015E1ACE9|nr:carboxynorspermidine decarboxylase [Alkalispirochaeta sphaeroplastigenens]
MTPGSDCSARRDPRPYTVEGRPYFQGFDPAAVPSPCYVVDRAALRWNLQVLRDLGDRSGASILLALKAFALPQVFPLFRRYLDGACASGIYEARLAREDFAALPAGGALPGELPLRPCTVHTFNPAYRSEDLEELLETSDHLIFNSLDQWVASRERCRAAAEKRPLVFGLRVNPECSLGKVAIYDPCAPGSRLGITARELERQRRNHEARGVDPLEGISEIHFHTLCEDSAEALEETLQALEARFGELLKSPAIRSLNMGGGHHITKPDYNRALLENLITGLRHRYNLDVLLEPGEAAVIHTGILVTTVLDLPRNGLPLAILDTSATAHMPDTLEMPYRAEVWGSTSGGSHRYRLGGQTCLAGDVIGDYAFAEPLQRGDRLVFDDMSHYTMVKTTSFNGMPLPAIALWDSSDQTLEVVRLPRYEDFRARLG